MERDLGITDDLGVASVLIKYTQLQIAVVIVAAEAEPRFVVPHRRLAASNDGFGAVAVLGNPHRAIRVLFGDGATVIEVSGLHNHHNEGPKVIGGILARLG